MVDDEKRKAQKREYMKNIFNKTHPNYKKEYYNKHKFDEEFRKHRLEQRRRNYLKHKEEINIKTVERLRKKGYGPLHLKTYRKIRKLCIRPTSCPICGRIANIIAHHPDYNKWNEIVFCCKSCHQLIHNNVITSPTPLDILNMGCGFKHTQPEKCDGCIGNKSD